MSLNEKYTAAAVEAQGLLKPGLEVDRDHEIHSRDPEAGELDWSHWLQITDKVDGSTWMAYDLADEVGRHPEGTWTGWVGYDASNGEVGPSVTAPTLAEVLQKLGLTA